VPDTEVESQQADLAKRFVDGNGASPDDEGGLDVSDLLDSIAHIGYQGIDQIVVRPMRGARSRFVVLEGNRRVAAIKRLLADDAESKIKNDRGEHGRLHADVVDTLKKIDVLVLETEGLADDESQRRINLVLGIRHHGSLLPWEPLPRAFNIFGEYMHELAALRKREIPRDFTKFERIAAVEGKVAQRLTIKRSEVGQFLRAYIAYCQLRHAGHEVKDRHFSLVKELVVNVELRTHYLPSDANYRLEEQSIERIARVAEFSERDKPDYDKILDDPKSVKKLKDLVCAQFDTNYSSTVQGLAKSNLVAVEEKAKSLADALDEVISAGNREKWVQALEEELEKLTREKNPLKVEQYQ
jgi:hypothetical protein